MTVLLTLGVVAALAVAGAALRIALESRALMAANVNGIHTAGVDAHRALGAVQGLRDGITDDDSTGRHVHTPPEEAA